MNMLKHSCLYFTHTLKRCYSALYITGKKAQETFAVLTPYIDFEERYNNKKNELIANIAARNYPLDIHKVFDSWEFFQTVDDRRKKLEATRTELAQKISTLMKEYSKNEDEIKKLRLHAKLIKDDLKAMKEHYYEVEEQVMLKILDLPNVLHPKTPLKEETVICQYLEKPESSSESHKDIAEKLGFLQYIDKTSSFLKGEASLFEQAILNYFRNCMIDSGFTVFCNPSFCRSVVAEGCADMENVFTIAESEHSKENLNHLHLSGGATLLSFMAYFTKHTLLSTQLPLKYFAVGKRYRNVDPEKTDDLFNLSQESSLNIFLATADNELVDLDCVLKDVKGFYQKLGYHFRMVLLPANRIEKSESLHVSIQMYSNHLNGYVEVGNISSYDSYLSKRLIFTYNDQSSKDRAFPKIIAGTVLNVPKVLGCVLENSPDKNLLSDVLNKYLFH
ncbi:unnamed protein product [Acanthoscelides obtectus]|uniref:Aminoacyl-tRNA synthetase class II (G/ P/ S/T) domain-containing protein n=1 Tax=Acanthoscelides obtectus TaxID=200917 RepID=A0A9P0KGW2_ACAOB|nr:unnamed protein product [Acanthoscelides obtectus]CAK1620587.1 Serine--tRNA synthetase-like protein Slimp [Acanthoscelides obtectus]